MTEPIDSPLDGLGWQAGEPGDDVHKWVPFLPSIVAPGRTA
jgi:hypothetical protein